MIKMKMRKNILAMNGVSSALMKLAVKSNSPISIAKTWINLSDPIHLLTHFDEGIFEASKGLGGRKENVEGEAEGKEQGDERREEREDWRRHLNQFREGFKEKKCGDPPTLPRPPPTPCFRMGGMKDNFDFDHILHFSQYTKVQLG